MCVCISECVIYKTIYYLTLLKAMILSYTNVGIKQITNMNILTYRQ